MTAPVKVRKGDLRGGRTGAGRGLQCDRTREGAERPSTASPSPSAMACFNVTAPVKVRKGATELGRWGTGRGFNVTAPVKVRKGR